MDDAVTKDAPRNEYHLPRRTGIWLLLASLLMNFFLLGFLASNLLRPQPHFPPFGPPVHFVDRLTQGLAPADAEVLRSVYMKEEPLLNAGHEGMDMAMQEITAALRKPTVDQAKLQKALNDIAVAHERIQTGMSELINHAATDLSPEGRKIFAENGLHPPGPPPFGGNGHMPPPPPPGFGGP